MGTHVQVSSHVAISFAKTSLLRLSCNNYRTARWSFDILYTPISTSFAGLLILCMLCLECGAGYTDNNDLGCIGKLSILINN